MRSSRLAALFTIASVLGAVALALPAPTPSEKAAAKMVAVAQAPVLGAFKQSLADVAAAFVAELGSIDAQLALDGDGPAALEALFDELVVLQQNATDIVVVAADARASAMSGLLGSFEVDTEGVYPGAFYPGPGTVVAKFDTGVNGLLAKTYVKLRKRVAKTIKKIVATGMSIHTRIDPPRLPPRIWTTLNTDYFVVRQPTIDLVVSSSTTAFGGDGSLRVGGEAGFMPVFAEDVTIYATFNLVTPSVMTLPADGRYSAVVADGTLAEGVWLIGVTQESGLPTDTTIAIR